MNPLSTLSRRLVLQAAAGAAALAVMKLQAAESLVTRAFEVRDLDWVDAARQRPVPVRLYLPNGNGDANRDATEARSRRLPLVVFSHGIGGSRRGYSYLGQHFARNGVASLHLQHVGSDRTLWSAGSVFSLVGRLQDAAQDGEAIARVRDLSFALDTLLGGELGPRFDDSRIVAAGHSYGANTTLLAAGARVTREGREIVLKDDRVRAAIAISAPPFYGASEPGRIVSGITVPSLHVTATDDVIRIPGYFSGSEDRVALFDAIGGPRKWLAVFEGGSHSMFTDRAGTGGVTLNPQVKAATQALTLAFVRAVFDGHAASAALTAWPQQHAGILSRFSAPG